MPKGWKQMQKDKENRPQQGSVGNRMRLKAGDIARVRFLTDIDEIFWGYFHTIPKFTRTGKRYSESFYCIAEDKEKCPYCEAVGEDIAVTRRKYFFWVYVYEIFHADQSKPEWKAVEHDDETMYKEIVGAPKILETGPGMNSYIENRFNTWVRKFKTLIDRDYLWKRTGASMDDTSYDLVPEDKSDFDSGLLKGELPSLEALVKKENVGASEQENGGEKPGRKPFLETIDEIFGGEDKTEELPF